MIIQIITLIFRGLSYQRLTIISHRTVDLCFLDFLGTYRWSLFKLYRWSLVRSSNRCSWIVSLILVFFVRSMFVGIASFLFEMHHWSWSKSCLWLFESYIWSLFRLYRWSLAWSDRIINLFWLHWLISFQIVLSLTFFQIISSMLADGNIDMFSGGNHNILPM